MGSVASLAWLATISGVLALVLLPSSSHSAAQPLIVAEWGLTASEAGFIFSAHQIGYVAATLILLPLTDRYDARRILLLSAGLVTLAAVLFPLVGQNVASASALRAVAGFGLAGVYMPGLRLVADQFAERRGAAVGTYVSAFYLGTSLSLAATGPLLPALGWRGALLTIALISALAPPLALFLLRRANLSVGAPTSGVLDLRVLTNRPAMLVILGYSAHSWELYVQRAWLSPFLAWVLAQRGLAPAEAAGLAAAAVGLATAPNALGVAFGGGLSDRFGRTRTAGAILALSGLGTLAIGWLADLPWPILIAIVVLYTMLVASDSAIYSTAVTELARPGQLGATQAVQSFAGFSGTAIAPVVAGVALDLAGSDLGWGLAFGQAGLVALAGVACLAFVQRPAPQRSSA